MTPIFRSSKNAFNELIPTWQLLQEKRNPSFTFKEAWFYEEVDGLLEKIHKVNQNHSEIEFSDTMDLPAERYRQTQRQVIMQKLYKDARVFSIRYSKNNSTGVEKRIVLLQKNEESYQNFQNRIGEFKLALETIDTNLEIKSKYLANALRSWNFGIKPFFVDKWQQQECYYKASSYFLQDLEMVLNTSYPLIINAKDLTLTTAQICKALINSGNVVKVPDTLDGNGLSSTYFLAPSTYTKAQFEDTVKRFIDKTAQIRFNQRMENFVDKNLLLHPEVVAAAKAVEEAEKATAQALDNFNSTKIKVAKDLKEKAAELLWNEDALGL